MAPDSDATWDRTTSRVEPENSFLLVLASSMTDRKYQAKTSFCLRLRVQPESAAASEKHSKVLRRIKVLQQRKARALFDTDDL